MWGLLISKLKKEKEGNKHYGYMYWCFYANSFSIKGGAYVALRAPAHRRWYEKIVHHWNLFSQYHELPLSFAFMEKTPQTTHPPKTARLKKPLYENAVWNHYAMKSHLRWHFIFRRHFLWFFPHSLSSKIFSLRVKFFQEFFSMVCVRTLTAFWNRPAIHCGAFSKLIRQKRKSGGGQLRP